ncbi:hypothetical protein HJC23_006482 [Cyclotella cryptica]|uniref:Uncharacterized protein n=1 Tax=Cyclotella cryptica TaxID=29204 RepID=A0ABD3QWD0_9STRA
MNTMMMRSSNAILWLQCSKTRQMITRIARNPVHNLSTTSSFTTVDKAISPMDEQRIISQLTPLKRILCLCPVPLGRGRVSWSGGDSSIDDKGDQTTHMNFQSQPEMQKITQMQPLRVTKYRYGERYAIGAAVSDAYLTHAEPVILDRVGVKGYVAEMVPSFRCDAHNLGSVPIFFTNLPYFRHEFLKDIGHFDIGAVVVAMPMKPSTNPFSPVPSRMQLEQELKLDDVRDSIIGVLQNYVSQADDGECDDQPPPNSIELGNKRQKRLSPLGLQGRIDHRMSIEEVLSKSYDSGRGSWGHITQALRHVQNQHTIGEHGSNYFVGNQLHGSQNAFTSVPPHIHAAVALNAMMEKYTSGTHNSFF